LPSKFVYDIDGFSAYVGMMRDSIIVATCSPSRRLRVLSVRQCTPPIVRPIATLAASLFSSPPTVIAASSAPVYALNRSVPATTSPGFQISRSAVSGKYGDGSLGGATFSNSDLKP
jgi:hypothetical protein